MSTITSTSSAAGQANAQLLALLQPAQPKKPTTEGDNDNGKPVVKTQTAQKGGAVNLVA